MRVCLRRTALRSSCPTLPTGSPSGRTVLSAEPVATMYSLKGLKARQLTSAAGRGQGVSELPKAGVSALSQPGRPGQPA